jgi:anthranilate synthase component 1
MFRASHAGPVDLLALHRADPGQYPFLLQSVAAGGAAGRYDILFAFPEGALAFRHGGDRAADFFDALSAAARNALPAEPSELPFAGGWFLLLGYELAARVEPQLRLPRSPFKLPEALAVRCTGAAVYDHERQVTHLVAERDAAQLRSLEADFAALDRGGKAAARTDSSSLVAAVAEEPAQRFIAGVARILEYLRAGDAYQVNLSRAWEASLGAGIDPAHLYERLRARSPAPFAGLAAWQGSTVISSSPERLVEVHGRDVQTRPIAGTRPRGATPDEDARLQQQLVASLKERAEHIMLIDLERNDLGRVCERGSIEVSELMTVESYSHVHHIVSNVRGRLRTGVGPGDVLRAVFPGGTITGCPKVRAMQIIAELEGEGRGPYTGGMGYLSRDGRMDLNILIRSLVCEGGRVHFRTGAGIVADSVAEMELAETRAKAGGLLAALGRAP